MSNASTDPLSRPGGDMTRRVLGWMLLISVVPLLIMAFQGYHCGMQAIVEKTHDHLLSIMNSRRALVLTWLDQRMSEMDVIASSPSVARCCAHFADLSEEEIDIEVTAMLRSVLDRVDAYDSLQVLGHDETLIARVDRDGTAPAAPLDPAFLARVHDSDRFQTSEPVLDSRGQVTVALGRTLAHGVSSSGKVRAGTILATLNLSRGLDPLLQDRAGMGETGKVFLLALLRAADVPTADGRPAAGPAYARMITEPFGGEPRVAMRAPLPPVYHTVAGNDPRANAEYEDYRGRTVWARSGSLMPTLNWTLVVEQDTSEALAWLNRLIFRVTLTGTITLIALAATAYWISNRLGLPLRVLARVAQQVSAGDTEERVGPLAGAEAEEVRRAFNKMLDELQEKQKELVRTATLAGVGELSSSIVHEMRNPLSSIKMNLQALRHEFEGDPANRELAAIAEAQVRRLEHMLDDLLQYGRPIEVRPEPALFEELAKAAILVVGEQARSKRVRIETKDRLLKSPLRVDREQMCRALTNLIANAIQAAPPGSTVTIHAHKESLYADTAIIDVEDAGPGLSNEAIERVFKPFFTTKQNGTGLGLANVRKIVELHGGKVSACNRTEGGACFSMRLPLVKEGFRENPGY